MPPLKNDLFLSYTSTRLEKTDSKIQDIKKIERSKIFSEITKEREHYQPAIETSPLKPKKKSVTTKSESCTPIPRSYYHHTK